MKYKSNNVVRTKRQKEKDEYLKEYIPKRLKNTFKALVFIVVLFLILLFSLDFFIVSK